MHTNQEHTMAIGQFKAECLREIELVKQTGEPLVVTKRGKPIVKIIPILDDEPSTYFGCLSDTLGIEGDIVAPVDETWTAGEEDL